MSIFQSMNNTASALTAQRLRMDVISSNMANADSTRSVNGEGPYRRKTVVLEPKEGQFSSFLNTAMGQKSGSSIGNGVQVSRIAEDRETPTKMVYDPTHVDANENGFVEMPNVDPLREMVDLISATRSYEANVTVFNASKGMMMKALKSANKEKIKMNSATFMPVNAIKPADNQKTHTYTAFDAQKSFSSVLKQSIEKINDAQIQSDVMTEKLARGEQIDLHQVMIASQKANITMQAALEIRNKVIEAYQEAMRMQV